MAILKVQDTKIIISGKTIVSASPSQELINAIQYNGESIEFDGEVLTFTES
jgi:hypothetical protein